MRVAPDDFRPALRAQWMACVMHDILGLTIPRRRARVVFGLSLDLHASRSRQSAHRAAQPSPSRREHRIRGALAGSGDGSPRLGRGSLVRLTITSNRPSRYQPTPALALRSASA